MRLVYTAKILSALSIKVTLQSSIPLCSGRWFKGLKKVFLINFLGFTRLRYFKKCTLIVMKSIAKISYITSYVLFITRATVKFINSNICASIYNSFTNILLIPISAFKLKCIVNILTNLATFTIKSGNFGFFGVSVSNFCIYQIILMGTSFTPTNHGRLLPKNSFVLLVRCKKYLCFI